MIKSLPGNLFNANPALKIAFLSHNEVDAIEDSLLQNKSELKRVDLGDNGFESVGDIFEGSHIASATGLPPNPSEIPVSLIPSDATVSLNPSVLPTSAIPTGILSSVISQVTAAPSLIVSAAPTAVPTSLVPEDVIGSIIDSNPTALLPSIVPTSALDPDLVSSIIATATNLAPGATGIPIGDIPTTAVVSFDPTAVPTSLLPTGIL